MDYEKVWSVNDIVKNRNNWSLSADSELLKHLQHLSKNLIDKTKSTLELLESFESDVDRTCLSVANIGNRFKSLSDSQFIENKIQESPETESMVDEETKESRNKDAENVSIKLKEALNNGLTVLCSHYDIINVSDSDSENEEPQEILLKSCNPFVKRRLPYIIGTNDFMKYDHLGLADSSSEDEEEDEIADDVIEDELSHDRVEIPSKKNFTNIATTQVIQISSSDSEDSVISDGIHSRRDSYVDTTTANNSIERNPPQSAPQAARSFADHLNAALFEANVKKPTVVPDSTLNDPFSPPPFPVKNNSNFSSDDEKSDSGNSVSSHSPVNSRSSPNFLRSPLQAAGSNNYNIKSNDQITDELFANESTNSKSVEPKEHASDSTSFPTAGLKSELTSDLNSREEKKLSRALADEFKSKILAKNNSVLPNRSSIESNKEDLKSSINVSTVKNVADETIPKQSTTSEPFHDSRKNNLLSNDHKSDVLSEDTRKPTLPPTVAADSSKISRYCNDADDDDDDDSSDEWFNRAVSSKTPHSVGSVTADVVKSSVLPSFHNSNKPTVKETSKDVLTADSKTSVDRMSSVKEKSGGVIPQTKKAAIEVDDVKKRYSLFGSDDENDDDDDLFSKKPIVTSDKSKTNELYEELFNDSDVDDPIQALVEENKRRLDVNKSTESIPKDSKTVTKPTKNSEIARENYSPSLIADSGIRLRQEMSSSKKESVVTANIQSPLSTDSVLDVNHGIQEKLSASRVTETDGNILSRKIIPTDTEKIFSDDSPVSDILFGKDEISKISPTNSQIPEFFDAKSEKEVTSTKNVEVEFSGSVLNSKSDSIEKNTPNLSAKTPENVKSGVDFLQSDSDESNVRTVEKKKVQFENVSSDPANSVIGKEHNEDDEKTKFSAKIKPGKLAVGRGINVNINALLPTSKWSKPNVKMAKTSEATLDDNEVNNSTKPNVKMAETSEVTLNDNEVNNSNSISTPVQSNLSNVTKDRIKISSKRRPPTRRGRVARLNAEPFPETSVVDESESTSNALSDSVHGSNSVTTGDPSEKLIHQEYSSNVNSSDVSINEESAASPKNISGVGTSKNSELKDVNTIFDAIFCDDDDEELVSNAKEAVVTSPTNVSDSSNEDIFGNSSVPPTKPSSQENKFRESNLFSSSPENDLTSSLISDYKKSESSSSKKIVDLPKKSSFLTESSDEDDLIVSRKDVISKAVEKAPKIGHVGEVERKPSSRKSNLFGDDVGEVERKPSSQKSDLFGDDVGEVERKPSSRKSDLFGDDDDEDFNKLFSSMKKPLKNLPSKSSSLFEDDDEDDDQLFGVKASRKKPS